MFHSRLKYIRNRFRFTRELIEDDELVLEKVADEENAADMFTKIMTIEKLRHCMALVGLKLADSQIPLSNTSWPYYLV